MILKNYFFYQFRLLYLWFRFTIIKCINVFAFDWISKKAVDRISLYTLTYLELKCAQKKKKKKKLNNELNNDLANVRKGQWM